MFEIWDSLLEEWLGISFAGFDGVEDYIKHELNSDWSRYIIYERIS